MTKQVSPQTKNNAPQNRSWRLPMQKNSQILALFAIVCTAIVGLVNELTKDNIKAQAQLQLLNTLHSIIEPSRYDNDITKDCVLIPATAVNSQANTETAYIARKGGKVTAIAMTNTAPDGYNGDIDIIVAINMDASVNGVRVLRHKETPGLGDNVELRKSDWITQFKGKKLLSDNDSRWYVGKDGGMFDQFTGATITPRAVVKAVKQSLLYFQANKALLLASPNACLLNSGSAAPKEVSDEQ